MTVLDDKQIAKEILIALIQTGKISESWVNEVSQYYEKILATVSGKS